MSRVSKLLPALFDLRIIWIIQLSCVIDTSVLVLLVSVATLSSESGSSGGACVLRAATLAAFL